LQDSLVCAHRIFLSLLFDSVGYTVIARSSCDEAIHASFAARWIASLRSQ
jgi:hypothetical protein